MNRDIICECLDREHFCDTCPNKDGSECPVFGCVYSHALSMLKDDEVEIWKLKAELKKYKQAEADGTLVRLPCKVGDTVYWIHKRFQEAGIISGTVKSIKISSFGYDLEILDSCGRTIKREFEKVFLTREEAEQALKELEGREND